MALNTDETSYQVPEALTIISGVFLALGAIFIAITLGDIIWRRGWKSMMWIMIPVYPINAGYMPPALYVYWKYGRPSGSSESCHDHGDDATTQNTGQHSDNQFEDQMLQNNDHRSMDHGRAEQAASPQSEPEPDEQSSSRSHSQEDAEKGHNMDDSSDHEDMHHKHHSSGRPMWATVTVGVMHCGAGCVLGDLVGEWLVYGTGAKINGADIWPCLLIDYGFALLFGIVFQYLSIAPMTGQWGPKTIFRAAKADIASLTSFEIGLFGWMVIYQVAIWDYKLAMNTWTYWWMMQVGMFFGFFTAFPVNWFLIAKKIKEPCA